VNTPEPKGHPRKVCVIGLGYVGLPVAVALSKVSPVVGFDISAQRVEALQRGEDHTGEVDAGALASARLQLTHRICDIEECDFYIVAVPTPIDSARNPDLSLLYKATETVASVLKKGDIVVYESTVYPGVTEEECVPILARISGLASPTDFTVGFSPERINPGDKAHTFESITKVVSGQDAATLEIVAQVYGSVVKAGVYRAPSIRVAEAAKVIENTQRDLNIALVNELSIIFDRMDIDTSEVLAAARTKWNFLDFRPGLVGGHCIGVDPYYLTYKSTKIGYLPQVILAGRRINDEMGKFVAERAIRETILAGFNIRGETATILGLTFKENVPDLRNTRVVDIVRRLEEYGMRVQLHDSMASAEDAVHEYGMTLLPLSSLSPAPLLILAVAHDEYKNLPEDKLVSLVAPGGVIIDVRSILDVQSLKRRGLNVWRL
jgi:UDP-N-acetyl-D-galactosamine dehydrogenase